MSRKAWDVRKNLRRSVGQRRLYKRFLIMTEGETEETYFNHYRHQPNPIVHAIDQSDNKRSLVEKAIAERSQRIASEDFVKDLDEAWVVFDRDVDPLNTRDKTNFNEALQLAENNGISVAYSNDAFELWLLLHFQVVSTSMHRDKICQKLSEHMGRIYEHGSRTDLFEQIKPMRQEAIKRATQMLEERKSEAPEAANPTTTVHILVQRIMSEPGFRDE